MMCKPKGVVVSVFDYDVDGMNPHDSRISRDPDGEACCINEWPAADAVHQDGHWPIVKTAIGVAGQRYTRCWKCPECGRTVNCSYDNLAEAGSPFCSECDREMAPTRQPPRPGVNAWVHAADVASHRLCRPPSH